MGGPGTLRTRLVNYNEASGLPATESSGVTSFVGVQESNRSRFAADSPFRTAEEVISISCASVPVAGHFVDWGGKRWSIKYVDKVAPNGTTTLLYTLALAAS